MATTILESKLENSNAEINKQTFLIAAAGDDVYLETHAYKWTTISWLAGTSTIYFEGSFNQTSWSALNAYAVNAGNLTTVTVATSGSYMIDNGGYPFVRLRVSSVGTTTSLMVIQDKNSEGPTQVIPTYTPGGTASGGEALLIAGTDTSNIVRQLKCDTGGYLLVNAIAGTMTVQSQDCIMYQESATALGVSATFTGTSRYMIGTATSTGKCAVNCLAVADQAGTVRIEVSMDGATWRRATIDNAVAANTPVILSIPFLSMYYRIVYVNGGVAQTYFLCTSSVTTA